MVPVVVIGMDPHKPSATIEVVDEAEHVLLTQRFATGTDGYRAMLAAVSTWPGRTWAVEGANGAGRHLAQRLVADGETVLDIPAKLSAQVRAFETGHGRKTDATDAHSVLVTLRFRVGWTWGDALWIPAGTATSSLFVAWLNARRYRKWVAERRAPRD